MKFVDVSVVAETLGVKETWVREHTRSGAIPHRKFGRYTRYDMEEVLAWAESCRRGGRRVRLRAYAGRVNGPGGAENAPRPDTEEVSLDATRP